MHSIPAESGVVNSLAGLDGMQHKTLFGGSEIPVDICIADVRIGQ